MVDSYIPKTFDFGFGDVVEVKHLETTFGITHRLALKYLRVLRIKPLYIGDDVFFSLPTFNRIMYVLSKPGSSGFMFPGSKGKANVNLSTPSKGLVEVNDGILTQAASPTILAEMAAASGRDSSMIKKLLSHSNAESRKEPKK